MLLRGAVPLASALLQRRAEHAGARRSAARVTAASVRAGPQRCARAGHVVAAQARRRRRASGQQLQQRREPGTDARLIRDWYEEILLLFPCRFVEFFTKLQAPPCRLQARAATARLTCAHPLHRRWGTSPLIGTSAIPFDEDTHHNNCKTHSTAAPVPPHTCWIHCSSNCSSTTDLHSWASCRPPALERLCNPLQRRRRVWAPQKATLTRNNFRHHLQWIL